MSQLTCCFYDGKDLTYQEDKCPVFCETLSYITYTEKVIENDKRYVYQNKDFKRV